MMSKIMYQVIINGKEKHLNASDKTIVEALGDKVPHGCKSGGCGKCKVLILKGDVTHPILNSIALSAKNQEEGYTLACQTKPLSDIEIEF
ncbi:MAG: 2Fe-2S iron-sulfur cluster-binding protein [SAR324 cluster bacterium]|nr:2Fe-2S iron-sulfur cluster-binding protein [SAR324 cluster bacterium]